MIPPPHLNVSNWDFADQLKSSEKTDETTHYVYSGGERVRKVVLDTSGATDKIKYERIYLGSYELYREYDSSENLDLERETHHVSDDTRKLALLEVKTINNGSTIANGSRTTIARYQYTNHLDSACLELNDSAEILSYEEYHPFGTTSYSLHTNDSEVSLKRYKYVHKELDDESGLYYYGARYYAPWLCRFVSVDPLKDEYPYLTDYNYAGNKPVTYIDVDGLQGDGDEPVTHTVQKGQTLSGIAQKNDMTVEELRKLNPDLPEDPTKLHVGTELALSADSPIQLETQVHSVKSGETLSKIAEQYGTTVEALAKANDLSDPNKIQVGQNLNIGGTSTSSDNLSETFDFSSLVAQPDNTRVAMPVIPDLTPATETPEQTVLDSPVGDAPITSEFLDTRTCEECSQTHGGTDYGVATGTNVQSTANGVVARSYNSETYGNTVILNHGAAASDSTQNVYTLYAHGSERLVNEGDTVSVGDTIMRSGNTGNSTGPHLHYEVIQTEHLPTQGAFFGNLNFRYSPQELRTLIR